MMDIENHGQGAQVRGLVSKSNGSRPPDPEVKEKATRRRFSAAYKARIVEEIDRSPGQAGAILRREGLYSSQLSKWREQRRDGTLKALGKKRERKGKSAAEVEKLRRRIAELERKLAKAAAINDAQKRLAEVQGVDLPKIVESGEDD